MQTSLPTDSQSSTMTKDVDLATSYRQLYRARFRANVEAGVTKPFVVPFYLLGVWLLPTLYLAIPHKNRPWLYKARWLVLVFLTIFHFKMATEVSSLNFACAYAVRLRIDYVYGNWKVTTRHVF